MKSSTKKLSALSVLLICVITATATFAILQNNGAGPQALLVFAAGTPDAYGNHIHSFATYQNTTGTWTGTGIVYFDAYTPGTTLSIPANQKTILSVNVYLNSSLAPDLATASTRARAYLNITGITTNFAMVYGTGGLESPYWSLWYYYPATLSNPTSVWTPSTDTTYNMAVKYQAYY